ncbi:hypothetical protein E3W66_01230 [Gammaproteobacteria bacterium LSUCC0057]|uniref:LicD/FKTN/FKRP nucleotidyltransferase domain-containing protein n=1 Tax=Gammaproteobacteria bacterium LSUCC0057 TaxID=2559237 RepID=A0A4Y8UMV1_9GAMM|nr:hypothetical protein E3W66_01230 [Gammaproteobacteria bacterium LSUCC0057]
MSLFRLVKKSGCSYYSRTNLELHQQLLLELLNEVVEICNQNGIDYWLDGGAVLGMVRHNGAIPWDDDIDLCVPAYDYFRLLHLLRNINREYRSLYYSSQNKLSWCEYYCRTDYVCEVPSRFLKPVKIDIFPIKFVPNSQLNDDERTVKEVSKFVLGLNKYTIIDIIFKKKKYLKTKEKIMANYYRKIKNLSSIEKGDWLIKGHGQFSPIRRVKKEVVYPLVKRRFCGIDLLTPYNLQEYLAKSYGADYMQLPARHKRKPYNINTLPNAYKNKSDLVKESVLLDDTSFLLKKKSFIGSFLKIYYLILQRSLFFFARLSILLKVNR